MVPRSCRASLQFNNRWTTGTWHIDQINDQGTALIAFRGEEEIYQAAEEKRCLNLAPLGRSGVEKKVARTPGRISNMTLDHFSRAGGSQSSSLHGFFSSTL